MKIKYCTDKPEDDDHTEAEITNFIFRVARENHVSIANYVKASIEVMLPYMGMHGSDYYII